MSLLCAIGIALVSIVAVEVLAAIVQGLTERASKLEPGGVATDLFHRLGFPFSNLGPPAALFLVLGMALMCLPGVLGQEVSRTLDRIIRIALVAVIVVAAILSIGSLLSVRYLLNEYAARGASPPPFTRVGFATFLIATLGTAFVAIVGSAVAISFRKRNH